MRQEIEFFDPHKICLPNSLAGEMRVPKPSSCWFVRSKLTMPVLDPTWPRLAPQLEAKIPLPG